MSVYPFVCLSIGLLALVWRCTVPANLHALFLYRLSLRTPYLKDSQIDSKQFCLKGGGSGSSKKCVQLHHSIASARMHHHTKIDLTRQMERVLVVQWRRGLAYLAKECAPFRSGSNRYQANGSAAATENVAVLFLLAVNYVWKIP